MIMGRATNETMDFCSLLPLSPFPFLFLNPCSSFPFLYLVSLDVQNQKENILYYYCFREQNNSYVMYHGFVTL